MKNRLLLVSAILLLVFLHSCKNKSNTEITVGELLDHVSYLASEELTGRYPGTDGGKKAADYILQEFKNYNLDVASPAGLQEFELTSSVAMGDSNRLVWTGLEMELLKDYIPMSYTKNEEIQGDIVFVGYGIKINKSDLDWDDFRGVKMQGKIALILEGGPGQPESGSDPFEGLLSQRSKVLRAQDLGAIGVMFVSGPLFDKDDELSFTNIKEAPTGIPVIKISRSFADRILSTSGLSTEKLELSYQESSLNPVHLGQSIFITTHVTAEKVITRNVIGILRAPKGPHSDEYIVLGGHYDHLGMGGPGTGSRVPDTTAVHYGADDNASGTSGIIELAGYFAGKQAELTRSMVFVAFAAEEMGLLGSKFFVENSPIELDQISAMFNLDMIGRLKEGKTISIGGTGTAAEFDSLLSIVQSGDLKLAFSPEGSGPSDHASFYAMNIPVLFISTGAHLDYHTPGDSVGSLNIEGMNQLTRYIAELVTLIASQDELSFRVAGPVRSTSTRQNIKVTLGFMPDFTDSSNAGLLVDFPTPGKPADRAGIIKGDRIVGINGLKVTNIQDYMLRMASLEAGQIVTVEIDRDGEKLILLIQL